MILVKYPLASMTIRISTIKLGWTLLVIGIIWWAFRKFKERESNDT